jgi:hypothetical protein
VGDLLGGEDDEQVAVAPVLLVGAGEEVAPDAAGVGQVEALPERVEVGVREVHEKSSLCCGTWVPR